ncbi:transcriptional regulator domain-containing protein [Parasphingorhabdus sp.]|uniref:transcriptional regulator domain-containing protein n=1 Tax=Parasphingorhabdus sp. TaxID=2709688 RepID=UPI003A9260B6
MSGEGSWRSADYAERFKTHDHADFAQEFLCRNPDYAREYSQAEQRALDDPAKAQEEREGLARRWGLSFPLRSDQIGEG